MIDRILTAVAVLALIVFVGFVIWFVPEPDLTILAIVVFAMVVFDFRHQIFGRSNSDDGAPPD